MRHGSDMNGGAAGGAERDAPLEVFDCFPNPIWRSGTDGLCDYFNRSWLEFTGRTLEQEIGNGWAEGVHPDDLERCLKVYTEAFAKRRPFRMEYRIRHASGRYHWLLDCGAPFHLPSGEFAGYIGSCYDLQDARDSQQLCEEFVHIATIELREPLGSLRAYAQALESGKSPDRSTMREFGTRLRRATDAVDEVVEELVTMQQLRRGKLTLEPEYVDPLELARSSAAQVPLPSGSTVDVDALTEDLRPLAGDRRHLVYGLATLVAQVAKCAPEGASLRLTVSQDAHETLFSATPAPPGMLHSLAEDSRPTAEDAPLGLYITQLIAEAHGGALETRPGAPAALVFRVRNGDRRFEVGLAG